MPLPSSHRPRSHQSALGLRVVALVAIAALLGLAGPACHRRKQSDATLDHQAATAAPAGDRGPVFEMTGTTFVYDGHRLQLGDALETWSAVLGPPTRRSEGDQVVHWDGLGIELGGRAEAGGHRLVSLVRVHVGQVFPGTFRLQGVLIGRRPFTTVQSELPSASPFVGRGRGSLPEDAIMNVRAPAGVVRVHAVLTCAAADAGARPTAAEGRCTQFIDELEFSALAAR